MTDAIGNLLEVEDYICYPTQAGHSITMNIGKVRKFNYNDEGRISSVAVQSVKINWDENPIGPLKKTTINKLQNIIKIKEEQVPKKFKNKING